MRALRTVPPGGPPTSPIPCHRFRRPERGGGRPRAARGPSHAASAVLDSGGGGRQAEVRRGLGDQQWRDVVEELESRAVRLGWKGVSDLLRAQLCRCSHGSVGWPETVDLLPLGKTLVGGSPAGAARYVATRSSSSGLICSLSEPCAVS